jgi:hypothetical protein
LLDDFLSRIRTYVVGDVSEQAEILGESEDTTTAQWNGHWTHQELRIARKAWKWLIARPEIVIGISSRQDEVSLDDLLQLPEGGTESEASELKPEPKSAAAPVRDAPGVLASPRTQTILYRPRIRVTEETLWRALTGHGVDTKRVPRLEWKLITVIGAAKEEGIVQTELVRSTGQDKRSVPARTDSIASKGYIIKRTVIIAGAKTSKLWLPQFAPTVYSLEGESGEHRSSQLVISREAVLNNLKVVPWYERWTGPHIDFAIFTDTMLQIIKIWGVIRYAHLRKKMFPENRRRLLKIMARSTRRLWRLGVLQFVGGHLPGGSKIFKDCIRFVRDPTAEELQALLAAGKKTSHFTNAQGVRNTKLQAVMRHDAGKALDDLIQDEHVADDEAAIYEPANFPSWTPEKPFPNQLFDALRRAGAEGTGTPQLSRGTVGYAFRRYVNTYASIMAEIDIQPKSLQHFHVVAERARDSKVIAYKYKAAVPPIPEESENSPAAQYGKADELGLVPEKVAALYGFSIPKGAKLSGSDLTLTELSSGKKTIWRTEDLEQVTAMDAGATEPGGVAAEDSKTSSVVTPAGVEPETAEVRGSSRKRKRPAEQGEVLIATDPPAAASMTTTEANYTTTFSITRGMPGSLQVGPFSRTRGRTYASLVIVFRSNKLKSLDLTNNQTQRMLGVGSFEKNAPAPNGKKGRRAISKALGIDNAKLDDEGLGNGNWGHGSGSKRQIGASKKKSGKWRCDKCGGTWKNDNGLQYHLTKAATPCNPNYVPGSERKVVVVPRKKQATTSRLTTMLKHPEVLLGEGSDGVSIGIRGIAGASGATWAQSLSTMSRTEQLSRSSRQVTERFAFQGASGGLRVTPLSQRELEELTKPIGTPVPEGMGAAGEDDLLDTIEAGQVPQTVSRGEVSRTQDSEQPDAQPGIPPFQMPMVEVDSSAEWSQKQVVEIVKYILDHTDGVFATGMAPNDNGLLWRAVLPVFLKTFDSDDPPSLHLINKAVNALLKSQEIRESVHKFRDVQNPLVCCRLIMRPHVGPHSNVAKQLREKVKEFYPKMYLPPAFYPDEVSEALLENSGLSFVNSLSSLDTRNKKTRKRLEDFIVVLNAPHYLREAAFQPQAGTFAMESDWVQQDLDDEIAKESVLSTPAQKRKMEDSVWVSRTSKRARSIPVDPALDNTGSEVADDPTSPHAGLSDARLDTLAKARASKRVNLSQDGAEAEAGNPSPPIIVPTKTRRKRGDGIRQVRFERPKTPSSEGSEFVSAAVHNSSRELTLAEKKKEIAVALRWPKTIQEMAQRGANRVNYEDWKDPYFMAFSEAVDQCSAWEMSSEAMELVKMNLPPGNYEFFNLSSHPAVSSMRAVDFVPRGSKKQQSTNAKRLRGATKDTDNTTAHVPMSGRGGKRTLRLRSNSADKVNVDGVQKPKAFVKRPYTRRKLSTNKTPPKGRPLGTNSEAKEGIPNVSRLPVIRTERDMTLPPRQKVDYFRTAGDNAQDLDWSQETTQIAAFVCTNTLTGGVSSVNDYGIMMRLLPEIPLLSGLVRLWSNFLKHREPYIAHLTALFQQSFIEAYEKGEVPAIDYDNLISYDWPRLVAWTLRLSDQVRSDMSLPASHAELELEAVVDHLPFQESNWRETYFHWQRSIFHKYCDATSTAASHSLAHGPGPEASIDYTAMATSWLRAACGTPNRYYQPADVLRKFESLPVPASLGRAGLDRIYRSVSTDLQKRGILIASRSEHGAANGKSKRLMLSTRFWKTLRKAAHVEHFKKALDFKEKLDAAFRVGKTVDVPYSGVIDGATMVIHNLQAHGRLKVDPVNLRKIPFGYEPQNYESRNQSQAYHHFAMQVLPTEKYMYNDGASVADLLAAVMLRSVPGPGASGEIPVWCNIFGDVQLSVWLQYLQSTVFMIATRGGTSVAELANSLKFLCEPFEVEMIVKWCQEAGILQEGLPGLAWDVAEWWWLAVAHLASQDSEGGAMEEREQGIGAEGLLGFEPV